MNIAFAITLISALVPTSTTSKLAARPAGDYVEARTASVFAGPCHYNGEWVTTGDDAVMAWNFASGEWHGTDIAGVRVMAVVTSTSNLKDPSAPRKCEILIDNRATRPQADAAVSAILARDRSTLGTVTSVRRGPIQFQHIDDQYTVSSPNFASMDIQSMPDMACCKQPNLVWYSPLQKLTNGMVGYTVDAQYSAGRVADAWERSDENGAFYGAFAF
jgi:hypothetical protein